MEAAQMAAYASAAAVILAFIGLGATAIYRIGKLTEATNRIPQEVNAELQRIREHLYQNQELNEERFRRMEERFQHMEEMNEERFRRMEERFRHMEEVNEERFRRMEELIRSEGERTREQIRNLHQAVMSHSHDEDGNIIFRIPPPEPGE